jgi:hypothetical protein
MRPGYAFDCAYLERLRFGTDPSSSKGEVELTAGAMCKRVPARRI